MTAQINGNYLEKYAISYSELVCDQFFSSRKFITGQEIIQLTPSTQVNFFIIKRLFELWQEELGKLKGSPYFDYRDIAVHEALTQFMNVLSRRIKVERIHLAGILKDAVQDAIQVATDPLTFFQNELLKAPTGKINEYLKENKKYFKWNEMLVIGLIDKTGIGLDFESYQQAILANFQSLKDSLDSPKELLASLGDTLVFDLEEYCGQSTGLEETEESTVPEFEAEDESRVFELEEEMEDEEEELKLPEEPLPTPQLEKSEAIPSTSATGKGLDAAHLQSLFTSESYRGMKGILGELTDSLALNQRFMFTKELFDGNSDLLRHALNSVDEAPSFEAAVELINARFVVELGWDIESEEVREFMQQVYRKFL
jgi:hypothetical protein